MKKSDLEKARAAVIRAACKIVDAGEREIREIAHATDPVALMTPERFARKLLEGARIVKALHKAVRAMRAAERRP